MATVRRFLTPQPTKTGITNRSLAGPGTQLMNAYSRKGIPGCSRCYSLANKMDTWGVNGCWAHLQEIIDEIYPRAKRWVAQNKPWIPALFGVMNLDERAIKLRLARDVKAAIRRAAKNAPKSDN